MTTQTQLHQGRARAKRERDHESIQRVVAFERWLKNGSRLRDIPKVPTDHDYRVARAAGRVIR